MRYGVFLPTSSNGYVASTALADRDPTFAENLRLTRLAESFGMDFVLAMVKFRGPSPDSRYWEGSLEAFTTAAGLLAATERIQVVASVGILSLNPAMAARMAVTANSIGPGRLAVNVVSGWNSLEYSQMGVWPGDDYFGYRYDYAREYIEILRELWTDGVSNYKGTYFTLEDASGMPRPAEPIPILCAGASDKGRDFTARYGDQNLTAGAGARESGPDIVRRARTYGRDVTTNVLVMLIIADTDAAAWARVHHLNLHTDVAALAGRRVQSAKDTTNAGTAAANAAQVKAIDENRALVGSAATVARLLAELGEVEGIEAVCLQFDDFDDGLLRFGRDVLPLLRARTAAE